MATPAQQQQNAQQLAMYQVSLFADFTENFNSILNRFTLHTESTEKIHWREYTFEPLDAAAQRESTAIEPTSLRCRKDLINGGWTMYTALKPESVRQYPEATVQPAVVTQVLSGNVLAFASALGYRLKAEILKKGYLFKRGVITIQMYQHEQMDPESKKPLPPAADAPWHVEVQSIPVRNTQENPLRNTVEAVLEIQLLMKGLLDLVRREVTQ